MGHAGLGARDHDGVEGIALAAVSQHAVDQLRGDLALGHAGADKGQDLLQRLLADALGADHGGDLSLRLDRAEPDEEIPGALQLHAELLLPGEEGRVAELLILRRELFRAELPDGLAQARAEGPFPVEQAHVHALGLLVCRLDIAGVGQQEGLFPAHEHSPVGKGEARGIALVLLVGDEDRVKIAGDELCADAFDLIHGMYSFFIKSYPLCLP